MTIVAVRLIKQGYLIYTIFIYKIIKIKCTKFIKYRLFPEFYLLGCLTFESIKYLQTDLAQNACNPLNAKIDKKVF